MKINYVPGPSKKYIRESVLLYFNKCQNILTLPNLYFDLEIKLLQQNKKVTCVERVSHIFKDMEKIAPSEIKLLHSDVKDVDISIYDGIFLDFMGTFNNDVEKILKKICPETRLVFTFLMARENKNLQKIINIKNREKTYLQLLAKYNIIIEKSAYYMDTSPMRVFYGYKKK